MYSPWAHAFLARDPRLRLINSLSKACRNSSWSCSVAQEEKAALDEVPGITVEEPDAVAGPHSDVDGIANGGRVAAWLLEPWNWKRGGARRRGGRGATGTRPLFIALFHPWPRPSFLPSLLSCFFLLYQKPDSERNKTSTSVKSLLLHTNKHQVWL